MSDALEHDSAASAGIALPSATWSCALSVNGFHPGQGVTRCPAAGM